MGHPKLIATVIDAVDARATAEFWRRLLGLRYQSGQEPPTDGSPLEEGCSCHWVALDDALARCNRGEIGDMKSELKHGSSRPSPHNPNSCLGLLSPHPQGREEKLL